MHNTQLKAMALDLGDARIGVALSDPLGLFAQPAKSIENRGKKTLEQVLELAKENNVGTIVIGLPYELDGRVGPRVQRHQ